MHYLKINSGKGFFLDSEGNMKEIHLITKEDVLRLLDYATDSEVSFEMDEITDGSIQNEAHRIIYDAIYRKFKELMENKSRFIDESSSLYKDAFVKYKAT